MTQYCKVAGVALVDASSILESAAATAYEHADNLADADRKVAMGVVRLIELAQGRVDSVLEGGFTSERSLIPEDGPRPNATSSLAEICGERACPRWGAKRP